MTMLAVVGLVAIATSGCLYHYGYRTSYRSSPTPVTTARSTTTTANTNTQSFEPVQEAPALPSLAKEDVMEMTFAGVAPTTIIAHVEASYVAFELDTATILELDEAKVHPQVIEALIARRESQEHEATDRRAREEQSRYRQSSTSPSSRGGTVYYHTTPSSRTTTTTYSSSWGYSSPTYVYPNYPSYPGYSRYYRRRCWPWQPGFRITFGW